MKTVTFGEIMLRLSPPGFERFFQSPVLSATFGGGEANVAVSLAHFGHESHFVTKLPANPIGDAALKTLRAEGVRPGHIRRGGERVGIYFAETGASQRASTVVYDRTGAAIAQVQAGEFPGGHPRWRGVVPRHGDHPGARTGPAACTREAIDAARAAGAKVSLDLNYRAKLWTASGHAK